MKLVLKLGQVEGELLKRVPSSLGLELAFLTSVPAKADTASPGTHTLRLRISALEYLLFIWHT